MRSEDLAKLLGLSRSTKSRVINHYPDIPPSTREKVLRRDNFSAALYVDIRFRYTARVFFQIE